MSTQPHLIKKDGLITLNFKTRAIQSQMHVAAPNELLLEYTRKMMGFLLFVERPKKIAMIGLGGGSIAKYCLERLPEVDFTAVDISPEVIALRDTFMIPKDSERFRILCQDGADFVRELGLLPDKEKPNVLLVDGFDSAGQPAQLADHSFYNDCFAAIKTGGVLVVNLCVDNLNYRRSLGRIAQAFAGKSRHILAEEGMNAIVFAASSKNFPPNLTAFSERLRNLERFHPVDLAETMMKILKSG